MHNPFKRVLAYAIGGVRGLTLEVRRRPTAGRQARRADDMTWLLGGPGGLPLGLASTDGLGHAVAKRRGTTNA